MRAQFFFFCCCCCILSSTTLVHSASSENRNNRRILHQPLFLESSSPPPDLQSPPPPPPPPPDSPDQPFFHELPTGPTTLEQSQPPPAVAGNSTVSLPQAPLPTKSTKKVAVAVSVGIVTLGMLSALAFFLYRHHVKHPSETQKLVNNGGSSSQRFADDSRAAPSSFLYIGTVEPSHTSTSSDVMSSGATPEVNQSPYRKLNSIKRSERYRPSPELQPLPPLAKPPPAQNLDSSSPMTSSDDEESQETAFHSPQCSTISYDGSYCTPKQSSSLSNMVSNGSTHSQSSVPHSKRTSPKSRLSVSNRAAPSPPPPPPPPPMPAIQDLYHFVSRSHKKPKFSAPPPPPNMSLLQSLAIPTRRQVSTAPAPPPPPPLPSQRIEDHSETIVDAQPTPVSMKAQTSSNSTPRV